MHASASAVVSVAIALSGGARELCACVSSKWSIAAALRSQLFFPTMRQLLPKARPP